MSRLSTLPPHPPKPLTSNPPHISASHCLVCFTSRVKLSLSEGDQDAVEVEGGGIGGAEVILSPTSVWLRQVKEAAACANATQRTPTLSTSPRRDGFPASPQQQLVSFHISVWWRFTSNDSEERVSRGQGAATRLHGPLSIVNSLHKQPPPL